MGKPKAPTPPDPQVTAAAQTGQNVTTAIANQAMGNVNQVTPYGNLTYSETGTRQFTDPNSGETYDIPTWTATQTLSDDQQKILDSSNQAQMNLSNLASNQTERLDGLLSNPLDVGSLPERADYSAISQPGLQGVRDAPTLNGNIRDVGGLSRNLGPAGELKGSFGASPELRTSLSGTGGLSSLPGVGGGGVTAQRSSLGDVQRTFGDAGSIKKSIDDAGQIRSMGGVSGISMGFEKGADLRYQAEGAGDITRTYGTDFSEDRQRVEDALMQRMDPYLSRDKEALEARLASQGIRYGSEQYQDAMGDFSRQSNDARLGAILSGGQEQSRLAGLESQRASFENQAQAQQYGQNANDVAMFNRAQGQNFGQNAAQAQFGNAAQAQEFGQEQARTQQANDAQAQRFGQSTVQAGFERDSQQQLFDQLLGRGNFSNAAQNQDAQQKISQDGQALQASIASGQQGIQAAGINANLALQNQKMQNDFALENANLNNQAAQQQYNMDMGRAAFGNDVEGQRFQQDLLGNQFANEAQQTAFGQAAAAQAFQNDTAQQNYQNEKGTTLTNNAIAQQLYGNQMAQAQAQNGNRGDALQEALALRSQPINEIAALLGGSQVQQPNFVNTGTTQMPTTDVAGIISNNFDQQMGIYNSKMNARNNMFGNLFGLIKPF